MSLREKKAAKTKLAILDSSLALMKAKPFEAVAVTEICEKAEVSYATFFNYFEKKEDVLLYYVQLWSVDMAHRAAQAGGGLAGIAEVFEFTGGECEKGPEVMEEIVAYMARGRNIARLSIAPLSETEKKLRYPHIQDFTGLGDTGLQSIFPRLITQAVERGELPQGTDVNDVTLALAAIFMGMPVALSTVRMRGLAGAYRRQLSMLWGGLQSPKK